MYMSKAFIGYVILALIIIGGTATLLLSRPSADSGIVVDRGPEVDINENSENNSVDDIGNSTGQDGVADDTNGHGQAVPQDEIEFSGFRSPITTKLYQSYLVGGESESEKVLIKPWAVTEDSRCPSDVQCVWAGRVKVAISFTNPKTNEAFNLGGSDGTLEINKSIVVNNIEFILLEVNPNKKAGVKISDDQYKFILGLKKVK